MMRKSMVNLFFLILLTFAMAGCTQVEEKIEGMEEGQRAVAVLYPVGNDSVRGQATFTKAPEGLKIAITVSGLKPGEHGLHLHKYGGLSALDSASAKIIFDPLDEPHGGPDRREHQLGDWGNIAADQEGHAVKDWIDIDLSFKGPFSVIGRSVVIHKNADDLISEPEGNAGPIVAYGTVGWAKSMGTTR